MSENWYGPRVKQIGSYLNGQYSSGAFPIGIQNLEGLAVASPAQTPLLADRDPVINEISVGISGNETKVEYVTGMPPLALPDSEGYPLQWWQVTLSPYQEGTGDPAPDNVRPIHGTDKLIIYTDSKYGGLVKWNQLCYQVDANTGVYGIVRTEISGNPNGLHYTGTSEQTTNFTATSNSALINGHKVIYDVGCDLPSGCRINFGSEDRQRTALITVSSLNKSFGIYITNGTEVDFVAYPMIYDLTMMFGAGNEPTIEQFMEYFPADNYPYNAGQEMTVDQVNGSSYTPAVITIPATGKNLLNIDAGTHNAWAFINIPNNLQPDTEYTFSLSGNTGYTYTLYLGNSIQSTRPLSQAITGGGSSTFTTPSNMAGEPFIAIAGDVSGAGNEPIASLLPQVELGSTKTPYEAYTNTIYSGQVYAGGAVSTWGEVDLGTLNYNYRVSSGRNIFETTVMGLKSETSGTVKFAGLCEAYRSVSYNSTWVNNDISYGYLGSKLVDIVDNRFTNASDFKSAVSGIKLVYPLDNSTILTISTPSIPTPKGNAYTWATAEDGVVDSMEATYIKSK